MEPSFWNVIIYTVPALALIFLLIKKDGGTDEKIAGHKSYKNYRKTRMDKFVG